MVLNLSDLKRMKVLFALDRLSGPMHSDVLSDGSLASRYDIPIRRPVRLCDDFYDCCADA
jgi:hypothetical protein